MTTFNKLLAIKDGGGNPGAPSSSDDLSLSLGSFASALSSFDLTASNNSLVAFDAASLDFGNANANPAFNFLGAGDFAVAGDALFSAIGGNSGDPDFQVDGYAKFAGIVDLADDLSVGGDLSVAGISTLTGDVSMGAALSVAGASTLTGNVSAGADLSVAGLSTLTDNVSMGADLLVAGNATFEGNVAVKGTLVTKQTESVLISDNYIDMNSDYTAVSPQDAGFTFNYSPIENAAIASFGANSITLSSAFAANVVAGDFILVAGLDAGLEANEGIYEVSTVAGTTIIINTAPNLTFVKASIAAAASPGNDAKAALINLAVLRSSSAGALQWATGANSALAFHDVPFDGYEGSQEWKSNLNLVAPNNWNQPILSISDGNYNSVFAVYESSAYLTGNMTIAQSGGSSYALEIGEAASDPNVDANVGKVYTKSVVSGQNAISELFYTSEIGGQDTPVQITKDGQLNISAITFSLQDAYDDGSAIVTGANGAVSISAGAGLFEALDVTGTVSITSATDGNNNPINPALYVDGGVSATGSVSFAHTGGSVNTPDFSVDGYAKIAQGLYVDSTLDVTGAANLTSSLGVSGAATLSSTLGVTGAVDFDSTLDVGGDAHFTATGGGPTVNEQTPDFWVDGYAQFDGAVWMTSTLNVPLGAVTFGSTLAVTGSITGSGDLAIKDGQNVDKFTVNAATGNTNIEGTLDVTGIATFDNNVSVAGSFGVTGAATLADTLDVTGAVNLLSTLDVTGVATFATDVTVSGDLSLDSDLLIHGDFIGLDEAAAFSVPAADSGNIYVSADPNAATHAELWYYGDGTANAVMITKNGQLNVDVLTFSLQAAYDDGATILIGANGPVVIDINGNQGNALEVTGDVSVTGSLTASAAVSADTLSATTTASVGSDLTVGATLDVAGAAQFDAAMNVDGAATLMSTLAVTGNITASADVQVTGILDLNGSVDADVTGFDVLSSGGLSLVASSGLVSLTASASDVVVTASGTIKLKGSYVASNINASATATQIDTAKAVSMTSAGLVAAQANAKDVIALGVSVAQIASSSTAFGSLAEFGRVEVKVEAGLNTPIAAGDKLYLSAAEAGAVTNVAPTASDTTVFLMGVALGVADGSLIAPMALRPQFLYSNY